VAGSAKLAVMVALDSDAPCFYWTFDDFEGLKSERNRQEFDGSVWKRNDIISYAIGTSHLTFDAPADWGEGPRPVRFLRTAEGSYEHRFENTFYSGVRADTQSHVVLTGRWTQTDYGRGVFILVLPIKQIEYIPVRKAEAVPLGSCA
jgi:hypothetical protein